MMLITVQFGIVPLIVSGCIPIGVFRALLEFLPIPTTTPFVSPASYPALIVIMESKKTCRRRRLYFLKAVHQLVYLFPAFVPGLVLGKDAA